MGTVISIDAFNRKQQTKRLLKDHTKPHCGPCYDADAHVQTLIPVPLQDADNKVYWGWLCINCESEFTF